MLKDEHHGNRTAEQRPEVTNRNIINFYDSTFKLALKRLKQGNFFFYKQRNYMDRESGGGAMVG